MHSLLKKLKILSEIIFLIKNCYFYYRQNSSAYSPSSRVYHRSIGISTSSATSRSTSKTCASHCRAGSEARLSENLPSTSELEEIPNDRGIYCKHGKYYEQIIRNSDFERNYSDNFNITI